MDISTLQRLMSDDDKLEMAVMKAKTEYLSQHHPTFLPSKEDLGEELYENILKMYPQDAAKITG